MNLAHQFLSRDAGPVIQFVKYAIGGAVATLTHIAVFHLLAWKIWPALQTEDWFVRWLHISVSYRDNATRSRNSMIDNGIAFVISNFVAYIINILWVFKPGRYPWFVELGLFYLVSGGSMLVGTALMGFLIRRYGIRTTFAFTTNLVAALLINYAVRKFIIFHG